MAKFLTELNLCPHPEDDSQFYLTEDLLYACDLLQRVILVPKGFLTDLASTAHIPVVNLIWGRKAHREAVLHDYLYCLDATPDVEQAVADEIFFEAMGCRGKPAWVRYPMFWGVRMGGWMFFKKKPVEIYQKGEDCERP
jgi:hypothetical protein